MLSREKALNHAKIRYDKIKDKVEIVFKKDEFGFKYVNFANLTMNDYGRMCELGYIISNFKITKTELEIGGD